MDKCIAAITVHLPDSSRRQFSAIANYQGLDCSSLGRKLIDEYLASKKSELTILLEVFEGQGTNGSGGTSGGAKP